jgi:ATP-dependent Lon protease
MPRDSQTKSSKIEQNKRSKKQEELSKRKKKNSNSDSDGDNESDTENDEMDVHEFRKYVQKIFPSKNLDKKIKDGEKLKKAVEADEKKNKKKSNKKNKNVEESEEEIWETDSSSEEEKVHKKTKKSKKNNKKAKVDSEDELSLYEDDDDDDEDEDEDEDEPKEKGSNKVNIIFTIGGVGDEEDEWDSEDEYDSDYEGYEDSDNATEDEDETVSSVSTDENSDESDEEDSEEEEEEKNTKHKKNKNVIKKNVKNNKKDYKKQVETEDEIKTSTDTEIKTNGVVLDKLKEILNSNPKDKSIKKCIELYEEDTKKLEAKKEKKEKKQKAKHLRIFRKIVRDKNTMNDFSFYEKLDIPNQKKIIKELREINKITRIEKPYRMTLLESEIPVQFKATAIKKINSLRYMEPGSGEFYKIKNWVDTFMRIPFGKNDELPISINDGVEKCHEFMENAQKTLDNAVYGLNDAKMQIMQMLGQLLTNPKSIGTAIAIHGPPGTGKTSLVKEGISKILNRPFAFIALGGATDSSFLEGHSYTYEGSTWGKIVQILIDSNCMNPVIYFDELDKISETPRGEEIAGILTHLTDTSQNSQFHDKYFAEINFDLSKCLFIFSYNDETKVNPILKDRMYRIKTKGYSSKEKTVISNNYLLPKIREQVKFNEDDIIIPDDTISHIIESHCNKEDGVRNMKRCLEIIYTKLNLYRLMKPGSNLFEGEMSIKVSFPFTVTKDVVDKLIKRDTELFSAMYSMYV